VQDLDIANFLAENLGNCEINEAFSEGYIAPESASRTKRESKTEGHLPMGAEVQHRGHCQRDREDKKNGKWLAQPTPTVAAIRPSGNFFLKIL
jgi:hypothetical protein